MYQFIESIKVDSKKAYLLAFHQKRVDETFRYFGRQGTVSLENIFSEIQHNQDGLYKMRIVYDLDKNFSVQMIPYIISRIDDFVLVENNTIDYSFKFFKREELEKMKIDSKAMEIIIVKNNFITDTSYSNLLFLKRKTWYTPKTYLLNGVQRQFLLSEKKIEEVDIMIDNIKDFSHFRIINSMNDFDHGFVYPVEKIVNLL